MLNVAQFLQTQNVPLAYGGYIFNIVPEIRERIPGHFLGNSIAQVPDVVDHLVTAKPPVPAHEPVSAKYQAAYAYFLERHGLLESNVWQILDREDFPKANVPEANRYMSRNIAAALQLGDLDYMGANLHWVEGMMINHNLPPNHLQHYLQAYYEAAQSALDGPAGEPILEWLADVVEIAEMAVLNSQSYLSVPQQHTP
jgi:hypothetical protein